jgi:hypothetical protein
MKQIIRITIALITLLLILLVWYDQSRSFYCIDNNKCVTVWKRIGGDCYILPGKYFGIIKPSNQYVKTTTTAEVGIIWDRLTILVDATKPSQIVPGEKNEIIIKDYNANKAHNDSIYTVFDGQYVNYKNSIDFIIIDVKEGYATDHHGNKLP